MREKTCGDYKMKPVKYSAQLFFKVEPQKRAVVEKIAAVEGLSLGQAARQLLDAGIAARGL
jgi:hypothetical protein